MSNKIKILIAGGCFPVQDNITPDKLYHQILKNQLQKLNDIDLEIRIVRYERIKKSFSQISEAVSIDKPDLILFHLRTEPMLLPARLFCKYHDRDGNLVKKINMSAFGLGPAIKHIQKRETGVRHHLVERSGFRIIIHKMLRELNYFTGYILGNWSRILKDYLNLVNGIIQLSRNKNLTLIITGPVSRPFSYSENRLSEKLHKYMSRYLRQCHQVYLSLLGLYDKESDFLFCDDLKRVNETGHKRISEIIYTAVIRNINHWENIYKEILS